MTPTSSTIDCLPLDFYILIQKYLHEKCYRNFMNCNQNFSQIKFKTVRFSISMKSQNELAKLNKLEQLICQVQEKSKQISLSVRFVQPNFLEIQSPKFVGIQTIHLTGDPKSTFPSQFDFSIFCGIEKVSLSLFCGVKEISSGLEGIRRLSISSFPNLENIYCNNLHSVLEAITIEKCPVLKGIPRVHGLREVNLRSVCFQELDLSSSATTLRSFQCTDSTISSPFHWLVPSVQGNLQQLTLDGTIPEDFEDFSGMGKIDRLQLKMKSPGSKHPKFPPFSGRRLVLGGFDLSAWAGCSDPLPFATDLLLSDCTGLAQLPVCPKAKVIKLKGVGDFSVIPSLPRCESLSLTNCPLVTLIGTLPRLRKLSLKDCPALTDLTALDGLRLESVAVNNCSSLSNVRPLRCASHLTMSACHEVSSFKGFDDPSLASLERTISLDDMRATEGLAYLNYLKLKNVLMVTCRDLHDIEELVLEACGDLETTRGLRNITNFSLSYCPDLEVIEDLQGIEVIDLTYLPCLWDFYGGLGGNLSLSLWKVPQLAEAVKKFQRGDRMPMAQREMFESIDEIAILDQDDDKDEDEDDDEEMEYFEQEDDEDDQDEDEDEEEDEEDDDADDDDA